jgi:recombination protein RecR
MKIKELDYLIDAIKSLPGIGSKQAKTVALFLIHQDAVYISEFIEIIKKAKSAIHQCLQCNIMTSDGEMCHICSDFTRDVTKLCIISSYEDFCKIEESKTYNGLYFVLNDEINAKKNSNIKNSTIEKLCNLLKTYKFSEVIIATNLTSNGETTAVYLKKIILSILQNANIYRLAIGMPVNSSLEYADQTTLKHAFQNKTKY